MKENITNPCFGYFIGVMEMTRSVFGIARVINLYSSKYHADRDCMVKSLFWRVVRVRFIVRILKIRWR